MRMHLGMAYLSDCVYAGKGNNCPFSLPSPDRLIKAKSVSEPNASVRDIAIKNKVRPSRHAHFIQLLYITHSYIYRTGYSWKPCKMVK